MIFKTVETRSKLMETRVVVKKMQVHANGLLHPGHMEWTSDGRLLVSEFGRGRVTDITEQGDYRESKPFASGLKHPAGIITNYQGSRIVVADTGANRLVDITAGGDVAEAPEILGDVSAPYGLLLYKDNLLATFTSETQNGLIKVNKPGSKFLMEDVQVRNFPVGVSGYPYVLAGSKACGCWIVEATNSKLLFCQTTFGTIYDVTDQKTFEGSEHKKFAYGLDKPVGMINHPQTELLFIAESGSGTVRALPNDGDIDARFVPPIVTGLVAPRCVRFSKDGKTMYACDMSACCVWRIDLDF